MHLPQDPFRICIFAGAAPGDSPIYQKVASELGQQLARANFEIVYGGGALGLMGAVADGSLELHGKVIGIIPKQLADLELAHTRISEVIVVDTMHQRKTLFHDLSAAFVVLPGGVGTLDELFETMAWLKLGIHSKPVILLNIEGYFDLTLAMIKKMVDSGFLEQKYLDLVQLVNTVEEVVRILERSRNF